MKFTCTCGRDCTSTPDTFVIRWNIVDASSSTPKRYAWLQTDHYWNYDSPQSSKIRTFASVEATENYIRQSGVQDCVVEKL